jgi:TP901 family phage tail tape measure protein
MPNNKQVTVTLKTLADISDVTKRAKDIQDALNKIQLPQKLKTSLDTTFSELYKHVERASEAMSSGFKTKGDVTKYEKSINSINTSLTKLYSNINNIDATKLEIKVDTKEFKELEQRIKDIKQNLNNINTSEVEKLQNLLKQKPSGAAAWSEFLQAISSAEPDFDAAEKALKRLEKQVKNHEEATKQSGSTWEIYKNTVDSMRNGLETMKQNLLDNAAALQTLEQQQEEIKTDTFNKQAQEVEEAKISMEGLTKATANYGKETVGAARSTQQLGSEIDQFKSRIAYFFGLGNAVRLFQRAVKSAFTTVQELDKALTETAVVTDYTVGDMWEKIPEYTERANKLGVTIKDIAEASTLYYQQGLKVNEVNAVTTATLKMARIAGLDAAEATDRMTNALRGFNMEITETNADRIADVYSKLAAISASNVDEISTAMTKTASLASNANMQFENTAAFLAQIIETTRESAETAGTALKTVIARFSEVKELFSRGELLGIDEEGEAIDVNKVSKALRTAGIDLNEYLTGMKGLDDIFMELASKWDSLDTVQQRYIATMAAGSRQQSRFIAMMQDYGRTQELVAAAQNASGAAQEQYQKTLDSLESKLNQLKNAWDDFVTDVVHQQAIKLVVDGLKEFLGLINKLTGNSGIAKLAVSFGAFKIGRGFVANMFKGTKLAELFSKQGEEGGIGFLKGFENTFKKAKNFNFRDLILANPNQLGVITTEIDQIEQLTARYNTLLAAERDTTSVSLALSVAKDQLNLSLASANLTLDEYNLIQALGLSEDEKNIILTNEKVKAKIKELAVEKNLNIDKARQIILEELEGKTIKKGITVKLAENAATILSTFGIKAETTAIGEAIVAKMGLTKTILGLNAAQLSAIAVTAAYTAGIMLLVGAIILLVNNSPEKQLKKATEKAEEAANKANEAAESYTNLKNSWKELGSKYDTLDILIKGTEEWKTNLSEVNQEVLKLIEDFPKLADFVYYDKDGVLRIKAEGYEQVKKAQQQEAVNTAKEAFKAKKDQNTVTNRNAINELATATNLTIGNPRDSALFMEQVRNAATQGRKISISEILLNNPNNFRNIRNSESQRKEIQKTLDTFYQNYEGGLGDTGIKLRQAILEEGNFSTENYNAINSFLEKYHGGESEGLEDYAKAFNQLLESNDPYGRLLTGELTQEEYKKLDFEKMPIGLGLTLSQIDNLQTEYETLFKDFENKIQNMGISSNWLNTQSSTSTIQNAFDKFNNMNMDSGSDRFNINKQISLIYEQLSKEEGKKFIDLLFSTNWDIDSLNKLGTQLKGLGIEVNNIDLQNLINQIIEFYNAVSSKATAENLKTTITAQNELINAADSGDIISPEQYGMAINAGIPENSFVMTSAGWVYTGNPDDLVTKLQQSNSNTFDKMVHNWNTDDSETNYEQMLQGSQIMGANGQIADVSNIFGSTHMGIGIDSISTEEARKEAIENNIAGLKAYADANSEVYDAVLKYESAMNGTNKVEQEKARLVLETVIAGQRDAKQFKTLTDVINDYSDALKEGNEEDKDYVVGLSKIAQAASKTFNTKITSDFVDSNREDFIAMAEGDIDALERIRMAIKIDLIEALGLSEDKAFDLNTALLQIAGLELDINGTADFSDIFNSLIELLGSAEKVKEFLSNLGYTVEYKPNEDGSFIARITDIAKSNVNSIRSSRKSKSSSGSKERPKYWDNPYDELYNLIEKQNEALRVRERLERDYDRILKNRDKTAKELLQNSLNEISNLRKEIQIQEQIQAGRRRMISQLGGQGYRNSEGTKMSFDQWGVTRYASYDYNTNTITIDWADIDRINDPDKGGAVEAYISKLEELTQSFEETQDQIEEMKDIIQEIKERNMQEYLDFEQRAYDAVIARQQKMIDDYSALSDTISESNNRIVDSLRESIDMERQIRDNTKTEEDIADKEARLEYLRRDTSGANQTEILKLEEELRNSRESYGDTLVDQAIDQLQKDNDLAAEQRSQQIEIMQAQLDWQDKTGYYWEEVYKLIDGAFDENGKVIEDSSLFNLLRQVEGYEGLSKYGKENFDTEGNEQAKEAYEGLNNWIHKNDPEPAPEPVTETSTAATPPDPAHGNIASAGQLTPINSRRYSAAVERFQQGINDLINAGQLSISPIGVDGYYGNETFRAVKALQSAIGVRADGYWGPNSVAAFNSSSLKRYAKGGLVNSTGLAWLDGTKSAPEMVLSARDTENFIALRNALAQMLAQGIGGKGGDNYFDIQISVDELGSDYDVDQLADRIKKQIYDDSSYRNVNAISYLR